MKLRNTYEILQPSVKLVDNKLVHMETTMILFRMKIAPIVTYGILIAWDHLSEIEMETLE